MRVLIAEDDPLSKCGLETKLTRWGYETVCVSDGDEAWKALQLPDAPRLAILDWSMPGLSGIEVCKKVRKDKTGEYTYLILLTGKNRTEDVVKGMESGADDYITKPCTSGELKARLRAAERILNLHQRVVEESRAREEAQARHVAEIQEREQRLSAILSSLHEAIILVVHPDGKVLHAWADPALDERYGTKVSSLVGNSPEGLLGASQTREILSIVKQVTASRQPSRDERAVSFPNGDFWFDESFCPMTDPSGNVAAVVAFMRDVTQRKRMQEDLHEARKLESVGKLASGIAHEINTPMQYSGDNVRFLQESFGDILKLLDKQHGLLAATKEGRATPDMATEIETALKDMDIEYICDEIPRAIEQSLEGIDRVTKIVRAMREFSHPGVEEKAAISINKAIESTLMICRNEWKYVAEAKLDLDPEVPHILCLPGEINQAILNLVINAAHAIADALGDAPESKGTITVSTRRDDGVVEVRISDTGTGIPPEVRSKIFDPFFTTKEVGKGTGQGLSIAHSVIVDKHGGTITFETETDKGTTFIIRLPVSPDAQEEEQPREKIATAG